jgi:F-type H+-transporting ATPase subunit b
LEFKEEKDTAFEELKGQIAEIAVSAAEKIIRESLDAQKSKQVIDKYLNDVKKLTMADFRILHDMLLL